AISAYAMFASAFPWCSVAGASSAGWSRTWRSMKSRFFSALRRSSGRSSRKPEDAPRDRGLPPATGLLGCTDESNVNVRSVTAGMPDVLEHPLDALGVGSQARRGAAQPPVVVLLQEDLLHTPGSHHGVDERPRGMPVDLRHVELPMLGRTFHRRKAYIRIASTLVRRVTTQ